MKNDYKDFENAVFTYLLENWNTPVELIKMKFSPEYTKAMINNINDFQEEKAAENG